MRKVLYGVNIPVFFYKTMRAGGCAGEEFGKVLKEEDKEKKENAEKNQVEKQDVEKSDVDGTSAQGFP